MALQNEPQQRTAWRFCGGAFALPALLWQSVLKHVFACLQYGWCFALNMCYLAGCPSSTLLPELNVLQYPTE